MMQLSLLGAADLRQHEGFVGKYYLDPVGVPTIGVGFTWASPAFRRWWGMVKPGTPFAPGATMTRSEADEALTFINLEQYGKAVNEFFGRDVPQHVFDAANSLVYNLGEGSLEWKWAAAAKRGDYAESARLIETTGTTAKGKKLAGLVSRRKDEARLMRDGVYANGAVGVHMPADDDKSDDDGILRFGERGKAVGELQNKLASHGLYDGIVDGIYGRGTELAVRYYQAGNKLDADGVAGPKTLKALEAAAKKQEA